MADLQNLTNPWIQRICRLWEISPPELIKNLEVCLKLNVAPDARCRLQELESRSSQTDGYSSNGQRRFMGNGAFPEVKTMGFSGTFCAFNQGMLGMWGPGIKNNTTSRRTS